MSSAYYDDLYLYEYNYLRWKLHAHMYNAFRLPFALCFYLAGAGDVDPVATLILVKSETKLTPHQLAVCFST